MTTSSNKETVRVLVWDLPTRMFHALLGVAILVASGIALHEMQDLEVSEVRAQQAGRAEVQGRGWRSRPGAAVAF